MNVRKNDNRFQAIFILASVVLFTVVGSIIALINGSGGMPWYGAAMIGAFTGLVIGFFASGIYLMIYRAVRHVKGKHD